jgi:hypothetical protein
MRKKMMKWAVMMIKVIPMLLPPTGHVIPLVED